MDFGALCMCLSMSLAAGSTHRLMLVFTLDGIFFSGCFPSWRIFSS
jgi:hypothetical protein